MSEYRNIAFVLRPHNPSAVRLDTMPFVFNSIIKFADAGWNVEVLLWEDSTNDYAERLPNNVKVLYQQDKMIRYWDSLLYRYSPSEFKQNKYFLKYRTGKKYDCVIGIGQISSYIAMLIAERNNAPLVIYNDEFPASWGNSTGWENLEREACKRSKLLVVPDACRIKPLLDDIGMESHPCAVLPNSAVVNRNIGETDWHSKLGISNTKFICINAGTTADWAEVPELMTSVVLWPDEMVLLMHERNQKALPYARKNYHHLEIPGRIFWTNGQYDENELNSLISASFVSFALYRNLAPNVEYIGFSSGKLMRSIALGVPVIASDLISLKFVEENHLGVLINHPSEIPSAFKKIAVNRDTFSRNCIDFYEKKGTFNNYWSRFASLFQKETGIKILL